MIKKQINNLFKNMETFITPRFHELGSSKKNNNILDGGAEKKANTCKNLLKHENISNSPKKMHKSNKTNVISNDINCFLKDFNSKKKFLIRNDFDEKNCQKFLEEKFISLEKPILIEDNENILML